MDIRVNFKMLLLGMPAARVLAACRLTFATNVLVVSVPP